MRKLLTFFTLAYLTAPVFYQVSDISDARKQAEGTEVTVAGILTCNTISNESLRYMQDAIGGIAVFIRSKDDLVPSGAIYFTTGLTISDLSPGLLSGSARPTAGAAGRIITRIEVSQQGFSLLLISSGS